MCFILWFQLTPKKASGLEKKESIMSACRNAEPPGGCHEPRGDPNSLWISTFINNKHLFTIMCIKKGSHIKMEQNTKTDPVHIFVKNQENLLIVFDWFGQFHLITNQANKLSLTCIIDEEHLKACKKERMDGWKDEWMGRWMEELRRKEKQIIYCWQDLLQIPSWPSPAGLKPHLPKSQFWETSPFWSYFSP